jgi:hypothetical protein
MNDVISKDADTPAPAGEPKIATSDRSVIYTFPIKVVVVGALTKEDFEAIDDRIWTDINDAMNNTS